METACLTLQMGTGHSSIVIVIQFEGASEFGEQIATNAVHRLHTLCLTHSPNLDYKVLNPLSLVKFCCICPANKGNIGKVRAPKSGLDLELPQ